MNFSCLSRDVSRLPPAWGSNGRKISREKSKPHVLPYVHRVPRLHYSRGSGPPGQEVNVNLALVGETLAPRPRKTTLFCGDVSAAQHMVLQASCRGCGCRDHSGVGSACHFHFLVKTLLNMQIPISTFPTKRDQVSLRNGCLQVWGSKCTRSIGTTDHV